MQGKRARTAAVFTAGDVSGLFFGLDRPEQCLIRPRVRICVAGDNLEFALVGGHETRHSEDAEAGPPESHQDSRDHCVSGFSPNGVPHSGQRFSEP